MEARQGRRAHRRQMGRSSKGSADRLQARLDQARQGRAVQAQRPNARRAADRSHRLPRLGHLRELLPTRRGSSASPCGSSTRAARERRFGASLGVKAAFPIDQLATVVTKLDGMPNAQSRTGGRPGATAGTGTFWHSSPNRRAPPRSHWRNPWSGPWPDAINPRGVRYASVRPLRLRLRGDCGHGPDLRRLSRGDGPRLKDGSRENVSSPHHTAYACGWSLATTLMTCVVVFRAGDDDFGVMTTAVVVVECTRSTLCHGLSTTLVVGIVLTLSCRPLLRLLFRSRSALPFFAA